MIDKKTVPQKIKMMVTVVDRGKGERIVALCRAAECTYNLIALGHGTANSEILGILGLGETDKDIVISIVTEDKVKGLLGMLTDEMQLKKSGRGIAFTIDINGVDSRRGYEFLSGLWGKGWEFDGK